MRWIIDSSLSAAEPVGIAGPVPGERSGRCPVEEIGTWLLRPEGPSGAVLLGDEGAGRRTILAKLLEADGPTPRVVTVAGCAFAQSMDYGALMFLLSRLPSPEISKPCAILDGLRNELRPAGSTGPTVVVVERAQLLDRYSAMALAQLALRRDIVLLLVCHRPDELVHDLAALWKARQLVRIDIAPLGRDAAHDIVVERLGGPVSPYATTFMWEQSKGNAETLRGLVGDFVGDGRLCRLGETWVLRGRHVERTPDAVAVELEASVSESARSVLLQTVRAGELTVREAVALGGDAVIDELFAAGVAEYGAHPGTIRARDARHADSGNLGDSPRDPSKSGQHELTRGLTLLAAGHPDKAAAVLGPLVSAVANDPSRWLAEPDLSLNTIEAGAKALAHAGRGLDGIRWIDSALATCGGLHGTAVATRRMRVCGARVGLLCGNLEPAAGLAGDSTTAADWIAGTGTAVDGMTLAAAACIGEAWALAGRTVEASRLTDWVVAELAAAQARGALGYVVSREELTELGTSVLTAAVATSNWQALGAWSRISDALTAVSPVLHGMFTLCEATLAYTAGELEHALDILLPSLRQFECDGNKALAAVAAALGACCHAELGNLSESEALLIEVGDVEGGSALHGATRYYAALAAARIGCAGAAIDRLSGLSATAHGQGAYLMEAMAAAVAVAWGDAAAGERLLRCAPMVDEHLRTALVSLVRAIGAGDPAAAVPALEVLIAQGGRAIADSAFAQSAAPRDKRRLQRANILYRENFRDCFPRVSPQSAAAADHWADSLSAREREVACHVVAGLSNLQIAHRTGVSVRTVEGHLYQIYTKLGVKRRTELVALAGGRLGMRKCA